MPKYQKPLLNYNADDVWAAACQAQRVNGSYVKLSALTEAQLTDGVRSNRELITSLMIDTTQITDEDREQGLRVRQYYQAYTFKILKGIKLGEFDNNAMLISNRDVINDNYDVAVIASLPSTYERGIKRDNAEQRIKFATGGFIGCEGDKVTLTIEVVRAMYSQKYNTYYVTGITQSDQAVFFAYNHIDRLEVGDTHTIKGTVKSHRDNSTQLSRVKLV
jgi:hypothetical protein